MSDPQVIYEDKTFLVLDKPAGWVVNDAVSAHGNPIVQEWLKNNFSYDISDSLEMRSGVVHRLDKETSGVLVIAKTEGSFLDLQKQFKERKIKKKYLALAHGKFKNNKETVTMSVGRLPWNRRRFGVVYDGKSAETEIEVKSEYSDSSGNFYSLLHIFPKTGRTHQIRVHLKHLGHPVVSDTFYAGRKTSRKDRVWCSRLFLHAEEICFTNPDSNIYKCFKSKLPVDLNNPLSKLTLL